MTKVKICGLSRLEDVININKLSSNCLLPDYVGFVFAKERRRYISPDTALELKKALDKRIVATGVFVDSPVSEVADIANAGIIDAIQLHGRESESYIEELRKLLMSGANINPQRKLPIVKAFSISSPEDIEKAAKSNADYILLDNGGGGTGKTFDWTLLKQLERPFFLAGGLDDANVGDAVRKFSPYAVDVSSSVETDGIKDIDKILRFIKSVKAADESAN